MKKIILATDSCADLTLEQVHQMELKIIPLSLEMEGQTFYHYPDERELKVTSFYEALREKKIAKTSLINVGQFLEFFEPFLKEGYDILYIGFSSALSGTYQSSVMAAQELSQTYETQKVVCIDSKCASAGQGLLVMNAHAFLNKAQDVDDLADYVEKLKQQVIHLFTVADLGTLARGGRLSGTQAMIGNFLKLKPILHVSPEGKLIPIKKVRGRRSSLEEMVLLVGEKITDPQNQTIVISHGDTLEEAQQVGQMIQEKYQVKSIIYNMIGPIIGAHSGPGTIAVFFMGHTR